MRSNISSVFRAGANAQQNPDAAILLVTVTHSELAETHRLTNAGENVVSRGDTFLAIPMEITLAEDGPDRPPQAKIVVANVDRRLVQVLRATIQPCSIKLEVVLISTPDYVEAVMDNFTMREVEYDAFTIQGTLSLEGLFDEPVVDYCFTPTIAPGLFG
jgi:hypothetical protein